MGRIETPDQLYPFRINLFGTPSMAWKGKTFSLPRKQARALIYVLAATLQAVPRDKVVYLFWPDAPEATARRNLSRLVSYVRSALPHPELLQVHREDIGLNPVLAWSDAAYFEALSGQNWPENREEQVALYRGMFLAGFSLPSNREFDIWLSSRQEQYERRYLLALKGQIQTRSAAHDFSTAIDYARRYLRVNELAEDVHQQLIELYAASGDRHAALKQFESCTLILERELGVEPLPETRAAYDLVRALTEKPPPQIKTQPSWTVLPSLDLPLTGRQQAWDALEAAFRQLQRGGLILLHGDAGIGKSRLLQEFSTRQASLVLSGNCHAGTQTLPYQPIGQALRLALSHALLWKGILPIWISEIGRLLPEISDHFQDLPLPIDVKPEHSQVRLHEALAQCILGIAANASILLCLDDLQWADGSTLGWLSFMAGRLAGSGVCILATVRSTNESTIIGLRESFKREGLMAEVTLGGLSEDAIRSILESLPEPPAQAGPLAARIKTATDGNPFFVLETLRALLESGQLNSLPETLPLADSVKEAILGRLAKLSPVARQVLDAASVLAPDLDPYLLQVTAGRADFEVADALDELIQRQMVIDGDLPHLRHDLLAQATYQHLNPWRRRLLHRRAAEALVGVHTGQEDVPAAQIAGHYDASGAHEQAILWYWYAAKSARRRYAQEEAIHYLERALELSADLRAAPVSRADLYALLGESLVARGDYEAARPAYENSLAFLPSDEIVWQVEIKRRLANTYLAQRNYEKAKQAFDEALALLDAGPDHSLQAWRTAWLDVQLVRLELFYFQNDQESMATLLQRVKPTLDEVGTPRQFELFYSNQRRLFARQERFVLSSRTIAIAEQMLQTAEEAGEAATIAYAKFALGFSLLWAGELDRAKSLLQDSLIMAEAIGVAMTKTLCLTYLTYCYRLSGDLESVRVNARRSLESAQQLEIDEYIGAAHAHLAWVDWRAGRLEAAERRAERAWVLLNRFGQPFKWSVQWIFAAIYLARNQLDGAVESARVMLHPNQQRLPDEVAADLESAIICWEAGALEPAAEALQAAVEKAKEWGFL